MTAKTDSTGMIRQRLMRAIEISSPVVVVAVLIVWTAQAGVYYFPPLGDILLEFIPFWFGERFWIDVVPSLSRLAAGFALAILIGVPVGLLLGRYPRPRAAVMPLLEFVRAIPSPALIPLVIILIGIGDDAKILLIALACIWPIMLNTMDGAAGISPMYTDTSVVYRIEPWRRFLRVVLPAAAPRIFAGMNAGLAMALIMVVVSEMLAGRNGIGFLVLISQRTFALADMWKGVILLGILGFALNFAFRRIERRIIAWHYDSQAASD